mmetsp:Transcript_1802/g.3465  ORF Transcript_1802/g.3465 Transcript_1802/m.3465 type:complete len:91 (+) Transcript_1802:1002-1274(+)
MLDVVVVCLLQEVGVACAEGWLLACTGTPAEGEAALVPRRWHGGIVVEEEEEWWAWEVEVVITLQHRNILQACNWANMVRVPGCSACRLV